MYVFNDVGLYSCSRRSEYLRIFFNLKPDLIHFQYVDTSSLDRNISSTFTTSSKCIVWHWISQTKTQMYHEISVILNRKQMEH